MLVALVDTLKITVPAVATTPVETRGTVGRIGCRFDRAGNYPGMAFGMTVGKRQGAGVAMEDGERIDPTGRGSDVDDPGSEVASARIGFFEENHGFGGVSDRRH